MAAKPTSIKIGKDVFVVPAPGGMKSFGLQQRIVPVAARVFNVLVHVLGKGSDTASVADKDVTEVLPLALPYLGQVFSEMPPGELEAIARILLEDATCNKLPLFGNGSDDAFSGLMQGRTLDTWKLLWHALKVWYPDFSQSVGPLFKGTGAKANPSAASNTSQTSGHAGA